MGQTFFFLSGLPRTGSTLLTSILSQNPDIYAGGTSPVSQLMWDMQASCELEDSQQLFLANHRPNAQVDLVKSIPYTYYKDVKQKYIVDKCRSWTLEPNLQMLKKYVTPEPKIIVLTRDVNEVIKSIVNIRKKNNWTGDLESDLWVEYSNPVMRPLHGVNWAKHHNNGEFLFIDYKDLISNPKDILDSIYDFFKIDRYEHYFKNIVNPYPEDDSFYELKGLHTIKPNIE